MRPQTTHPPSVHLLVCPRLICRRPETSEQRSRVEQSGASSVNSNSCHQSQALVTPGAPHSANTRLCPECRHPILDSNRRECRLTVCQIFCPLKCYDRFKMSAFVYLNLWDGKEASNNMTTEKWGTLPRLSHKSKKIFSLRLNSYMYPDFCEMSGLGPWSYLNNVCY